jgi:hypothetical protein
MLCATVCHFQFRHQHISLHIVISFLVFSFSIRYTFNSTTIKHISFPLVDSSVGIATDYRLNSRGIWVRFSAGARDFSFLYIVQRGPEAHPGSFPMSTGGTSLGIKRPGPETEHSPFHAELRIRESVFPLPHTSSWCST